MGEDWLLDGMIFGGALVFMAVVWLLMDAAQHGKKQQQRMQRVTGGKQPDMQQEIAQSLRRRKQESRFVFAQEAGFITRLQHRLETAGYRMSAQKYLLVSLGLMLLVSGFILLIGKPLLLALPAGLALGFGLPHFLVGYRIRRYQKLFLQLFPDGIDLIVRGLRAGLPVGESIQNVAREIPAPVGPVFGRIAEQTALGVPMDRALMDAARRLGITEFNFFVISTVLQSETGGNLGEILNNLSDVLRQRHIMKLRIKAFSSEARASAIIVGALPFVVFIAVSVLSPGYMDPFYEDFRGNIAALGALSSLGLGVFIMAKMTQFEI